MATVNGETGYDMNYTMVGSGGAAAGSGASSSSLLSASNAKLAGSALSDFGTAAGDFMSIGTDMKSAGAYGEAAALAGENIDITKTATNIQVSQSQRALAKTLGQQSAAESANGFVSGSGSGADLFRASAEQGALAQSLITAQGSVTENAYRAQQTADLALEAQAKAKAKSDMFGGVMSTVEGVASVALMFA